MEDAGLFSKVFFLWAHPLVRSGFRRAVLEDSSLTLPERADPHIVYDRFERLWKAEVAKAKLAKNDRKPSLAGALGRLLCRDLFWSVTLQVLVVMCRFAGVLLLRRIVQIIGAGTGQKEGIPIAVALWASNLAVGIIAPLASFRLQLALLQLAGTFAQATLQKGVALHPELRESNRRGDLVSLALSDCSRLIDMSNVLMQGASAPFMLVVTLVLLVILVGPMVLAVLVTISMSFFLVRTIGKRQGASFRRKSVAQGKRLGILNEMLQSIRFTKYYTLEDHYGKQMMDIRREEQNGLFRMKLLYGLNLPVACTVPLGIFVVILMLHWLVHGSLPDAADTFAIIAAARTMYYPFYFFGGFLAGVSMLSAACGRLQSLLILAEVKRLPLTVPEQGAEPRFALACEGKSFSWSLKSEADALTLKSITMKMPPGELWAVVGKIGSGKSSLLAAALGDIAAVDAGTGPGLCVSGTSRAYLSQEPMVMNATLRDNIQFGSDVTDEAKYINALKVAALGPDLEVLPAGDATEIGEKGITLSGGQKARVALARVAFASQPGGVVLLDDPLAAVDAHVGKYLFERCLCEALHSTSRLLVTNQLHFLSHPEVKCVLVLENGSVVEQGTFAELMADPKSCFAQMAGDLGGAQEVAQTHGQSLEEETPPPCRLSAIGSVNIQQATVNRDETHGGRLSQKEHKEEGAVSLSTVYFFVQRMGGIPVLIVCAICSWVIHLVESIFPDMLMAAWQDDLLDMSSEFYMISWLSLAGISILLVVVARLAWIFATFRASNTICSQLLKVVLHCPTSFFDRTPSGRIMNRLGEDQSIVDWLAPLSLEVLIIVFWRVFDVMAVAVIARPLVAVVVLPCLPLLWCIREVHRRTTRETLRWWMLTKSPVFHTFEETLSGMSTIFAFGRERYFFGRFEAALRANLRWLMSKDVGNNWAKQRLELVSSMVVLSLSLLLVLTDGTVSTSMAAVAITCSLTLGESLVFFTEFLVTVEGSFASVERVKEFTEGLEQEPPRTMDVDDSLIARKWPDVEADLVFEKVSVRYLEQMPRALDSLSFCISAREKVGIVGRTGSGKSTVMGALFRLFPLEEGRILLGGVDVAQVGVGLLRQQITIVPQDPVLFSGEVRRNLDPLAIRSDSEIWDALKRSELADLVQGLPGGLLASVSEGGSNFSVGERQVFCLVRALLRDARVLCLDEATANVDPVNDARIQHMLLEEIKNALVLTIAHRLHTVLKSDRILVLSSGKAEQMDTPKNLLAEPGIFRDLAVDAGISLSLFEDGEAPTRQIVQI